MHLFVVQTKEFVLPCPLEEEAKNIYVFTLNWIPRVFRILTRIAADHTKPTAQTIMCGGIYYNADVAVKVHEKCIYF